MTTPYPKNVVSRDSIITNMCYTWRHDYGAPASEEFTGLGMTDEEREFLWRQMAQIFDNDIYPYLEFRTKN